MPFQSEAQQRWAFGTGQPFAERWARETNFRRLPSKKEVLIIPSLDQQEQARQMLYGDTLLSPVDRAKARTIAYGTPMPERSLKRVMSNAMKAGQRHSASDLERIKMIREHTSKINQLLSELGTPDDIQDSTKSEDEIEETLPLDDLTSAYEQIMMMADENGLTLYGIMPCGESVVIATEYGYFKIRCIMTDEGIVCESADRWSEFTMEHGDDDEYSSYRSLQAVKALDADGYTIGGYAFLFGTEDTADLSPARDYATKSTEFWLDQWKTRPIVYEHGIRKDAHIPAKLQSDPIIGTWLEATTDEIGVFIRGEIDRANEYADAIRELVRQGKVRLSSDSLSHLVVREAKANGVHELKRWPLAAVSLTMTPADPSQIMRVVKQIKTTAQDAGALKASGDEAARLLIEIDLLTLEGA